MRNSAPEPAPTTWPASTLRVSTRPAVGRADVEPADAGAGRAERGLGDADAGRRGVAGGALAVEIGLADEAAADQRLGAVELVLGEAKIGAGHLDLGGELGGLLAPGPSG